MRIASVARRLPQLHDSQGCSNALEILADVKKIYWFPFVSYGYFGIDQIFTLAVNAMWRYIETVDREASEYRKRIFMLYQTPSLSTEISEIMDLWEGMSIEKLEQEYKRISTSPLDYRDTLMEILRLEIFIDRWKVKRAKLVEKIEIVRNNSKSLLEYGINPVSSLPKT